MNKSIRPQRRGNCVEGELTSITAEAYMKRTVSPAAWAIMSEMSKRILIYGVGLIWTLFITH
ncbi:hypothetical protein HOLleu_08477 [Holothuria leucospilota]|uniref:Uncharacterized protein n=1 Tax=Holothuria leucospilota TaxID=206669 RepID=A0A9Q1HDI1_HOLLE|nr:hypothetical protein HOLleu_08477 [Holothuria leucospilota]